MIIKCYLILSNFVGNDLYEVNTAIEKLDLGGNVFEIVENNSLCNLITRSHLVYLDLSNCGLEGNSLHYKNMYGLWTKVVLLKLLLLVIPDDVVLALSSNKFLQVFVIAGNRLGSYSNH